MEDLYGSGSGMSVEDRAEAFVERANGVVELPGILIDLSALNFLNLAVGGTFNVECYDSGGEPPVEATRRRTA
jgi:hypothetical protein